MGKKKKKNGGKNRDYTYHDRETQLSPSAASTVLCRPNPIRCNGAPGLKTVTVRLATKDDREQDPELMTGPLRRMSRIPTDWEAKSRHAAGTPDVTAGDDSGDQQMSRRGDRCEEMSKEGGPD